MPLRPLQDRALIKRIQEQEKVKGDLAQPVDAAVVPVGAAAETEMKEKKTRVEECGASKHELPGRRHRSRRRRSFPPSHS